MLRGRWLAVLGGVSSQHCPAALVLVCRASSLRASLCSVPWVSSLFHECCPRQGVLFGAALTPSCLDSRLTKCRLQQKRAQKEG